MADHRVGTLFVELDLDPSRYMRGQQTLLKEAQNGATILEKNFHNLGIKSDATYDLMRARAEKSFQAIAASGKATADDLIRAEKAKTEAITNLNEQQYGAQKTFFSKISTDALSMAKYIGLAFGAQQVIAFGKNVFDAGLLMDSTKRAFIEITGSATNMSKEFSFLRELANKTGQNFYDLTGVYKGFLAASKGTNLEGEATQQIFGAVTKAAATLGLTTDATQGSLVAIQQMMSKGKVSAEELRQQLGERLPGAFNLMAEAMGVSASKLDAMLKKGEVLAEDALPKLAAVLEGRYSGAVSEATAAVNKLSEAWMDFKVAIADSGFLALVSELMNNLAITAREAAKVLDARSKLIEQNERLHIVPSASEFKTNQAFEAAKQLAVTRLKENAAIIGHPSLGLTGVSETPYIYNAKQYAEANKERIKSTEKATKDYADALKEAEKYQQEFSMAVEGSSGNAALLDQQLMNTSGLYWEMGQTQKEVAKAAAKEIEKQTKAEQKAADNRQDAYQNMYKDLKDQDGSYYKEQYKLIDDRAKDYAIMTEDQVLAEKWKKNELAKLLIEEQRNSDSMIQGMQAGWMQLQRDQITWGQVGYDAVKTFTADSATAMARFINPTKDSFMDLQAFGETIWQGMLDSLVENLSQMLVEMVIFSQTSQQILGSIGMGGIYNGGTAQAGAGGGMGLISTGAQGYGLYNMFGGGSAAGGVPVGDIAGLGPGGMFAESGSGVLATFGPWLAGIGGGYLVGTQLLGGDSMKSAGGAVVGSAIGSIIMPGVGTIAGGLLGGALGGIFHDGGKVGYDSVPSKQLPANIWANAPRAHLGLKVDEVPIIAKKGERILSERETTNYERGEKGVTINFYTTGNIIGDRQAFDDFAEKIDYAINKRNKRIYG